MNEDVRKNLENWTYLQELPQKNEDFVLTVAMLEVKEMFVIFRYVCQERCRQVICFYNKTTGDFMLRRVYGLNEYNDMAFITPSLEVFEKLLREKLDAVIQSMYVFHREQASLLLAKTGLLEYDFKDLLPQSLCGFSLYIKPSEPVAMINGSHVVLDYSDFTKDAQLVIYYNELKCEFYAEKKVRGIVQTTGCMDARNIKDLCKRLQDLPEILNEFRSAF